MCFIASWIGLESWKLKLFRESDGLYPALVNLEESNLMEVSMKVKLEKEFLVMSKLLVFMPREVKFFWTRDWSAVLYEELIQEEICDTASLVLELIALETISTVSLTNSATEPVHKPRESEKVSNQDLATASFWAVTVIVERVVVREFFNEVVESLPSLTKPASFIIFRVSWMRFS